MFRTISALTPPDPDYPERTYRLDMLRRVLDGELYDVLPYPFSEERNRAGEYIPLRQRRPSARYNLCRLVVEDSVGLLFGEGRFPALQSEDEATRQALAALMKEGAWNAQLADAAIRGSIGSVAVVMRILRGRVFLDVIDSPFLTPTFDAEAPDTLVKLTEARKVKGRDLEEAGYTVPREQREAIFWYRREWGVDAETWYVPQPLAEAQEGKPPVVDEARTVRHPLGFVPALWLTNLPGGKAPDGECTFKAAIDTQIELEYLLSQGGRGLKYASDPLLMIREPAAADEKDIVRSAGNALIVSEKGDAKLLEIGGTATEAVLEHVRALRELALESLHGNRSNADKISAAQSGRAMELMNAPLISLADRLRVSYGEGGLLRLAQMVARASRAVPLSIGGRQVRDLDPEGISLRWNGWFSPTEGDKLQQAQGLQTLTGAGLLSRETAVASVAGTFDIEDTAAELVRLDKERAMAPPGPARAFARRAPPLDPAKGREAL